MKAMRASAAAIPFAKVAQCPLCERRPHLFVDRSEIEEELRMRDAFFAQRFARHFSNAELVDVTSAIVATPADILRCAICGILVRDQAPDDDAFRDDRYEDRVLESLYATHAAAFRAKERDYRSLLPEGSRIVEIGSYVGGFLTAAREWGWIATGVDIGTHPTRFSRALGFDARCLRFEDANFERASLDAVFIWNCFEQLADPGRLLVEVRRVLRPFGILVIRVPDADFYVQGREAMRTDRTALARLAYNELLGWGFRFGFDLAALRRLAEHHQFALDRVLHRPVIRPLRTAMHSWAQAEESALIAEGASAWMELMFRKRHDRVA